VNVRVGLGEDYPIVYRYLRKGIPVQVMAEFKTWVKIRDKDGDEGWVANRLLSNKNTIIISKNTILYTKPLEKSIKLAIVEKGVIAEKIEENSGFLKIKLNTKTGWIKKDDVWGVDL
jgi:SH3-like domain-containing protein